ncbi:DUF4062 domain-containing protein [Achromobacter xylosoxidans]
MEKRYQIFVSSTFRDLEVERQEVMHALLELDCIPSGMELFPAANEDQWNLIQRVIDDCDYYLLILGEGTDPSAPTASATPKWNTGTRYQNKNRRLHFFTAIRERSLRLTRNPRKKEGKAQVVPRERRKKLCKYWDSPQELGSVVSRSLIQLIKSTPAVGWVRANELADREATVELLQLRRRVEDLQKELDHVRTSAPKESEGLAQGDELHLIHYEFEIENPFTYDSEECTATFNATWNEILELSHH